MAAIAVTVAATEIAKDGGVNALILNEPTIAGLTYFLLITLTTKTPEKASVVYVEGGGPWENQAIATDAQRRVEMWVTTVKGASEAKEIVIGYEGVTDSVKARLTTPSDCKGVLGGSLSSDEEAKIEIIADVDPWQVDLKAEGAKSEPVKALDVAKVP